MKPSKYLHSLQKSLAPEDNALLPQIESVASVLGLALAVYLSTLRFEIPEQLTFIQDNGPALKATVNIEKQKTLNKKKKPPKPSKQIQKQNKGVGDGRKDNGGGSIQKQSPTNFGVLTHLKKNSINHTMHNIMKTTSKDLEKVLNTTSVLSQASKSNPGIGIRRGKVDAGMGLGRGSGEGSGNSLANQIGELIGGVGPKIVSKKIRKITPKEIDFGPSSQGRSMREVMRVINSRMPGLRHIYNKHLKTKPEFAGKVTLRFDILAGGSVVNISIVSSSTKYTAFDVDIKNKVRRWRFPKIKSGTTTITVPFTFSE